MAMERFSTILCYEFQQLSKTLDNFLIFLKLLSFFECLKPQGPENHLYGLILSFCIVFNCNQYVLNFLISQILSFLMKFAFFFISENIFLFPFFLSQWSVNLPWGLLVFCIVAKVNGMSFFNIANFCIFKRLKFFKISCKFSCFLFDYS